MSADGQLLDPIVPELDGSNRSLLPGNQTETSDEKSPHVITARNLKAELAELEDIPGTRIFTAARARQGYHLNQFAMSLMKPVNREAFKADERAYLDQWPMTAEQRHAVLKRDYNRAIELGGNIYFLAKLIFADGISFAQGVATMTGMSFEDYTEMMVAGGRSPVGQRSIKDKY